MSIFLRCAYLPFVLCGALLPAGCGSSSGSSQPPSPEAAEAAAAAVLPADQQALLGSYEVPLRAASSSGGGSGNRLRIDFVAATGGVEAYVQSNPFGIAFQRASLTLSTETATLTFSMYGNNVVLTVARSVDGRPGRAELKVSSSYVLEGELGPDTTKPSLSGGLGTATPPWQPNYIRFSETLRSKDITLPAPGEIAYTLAPIEGTPWIAFLGFRKPLSKDWDSAREIFVDGVTAKDPGGNDLEASRVRLSWPILGAAVKAYDFSKDNPAFPQIVSRLITDCDTGATACLRVSQGTSLGLRIAAGSKALRIRYALLAGPLNNVPPKSTVKLSGIIAPGDGSETSKPADVEVVWTPSPNPTATKAFSTAYADLVIPLPKQDVETGISLQLDGEPREPTPASPSNPGGVAAVRQMVLVVQSARAE